MRTDEFAFFFIYFSGKVKKDGKWVCAGGWGSRVLTKGEVREIHDSIVDHGIRKALFIDGPLENNNDCKFGHPYLIDRYDIDP